MSRLIGTRRVQVFRSDLSPRNPLCFHELLHVFVNIVDFAFSASVGLARLDGGSCAHLVVVDGNIDFLNPVPVLANIHKTRSADIPD